MVCACYLLFKATYFLIVIGYPLKCLHQLGKEGKTDKTWIFYFFLLTFFYLCESTILFPLKLLLDRIDFCMFPTVKALFALWLYHPGTKGVDFIEAKAGPYLDKAFLKVNPFVGKHLEKIGIINKDNLKTE